MEQFYEIAGVVIVVTLIVSTVLIGLFKFSFGASSHLNDLPENNRKWHAMGLSSLEYAQRCMPVSQRRKYIVLLKVQRYSLYLMICYLVLNMVLSFISAFNKTINAGEQAG